MAGVVASRQSPFLWEGKDRKGNRVKGRASPRTRWRCAPISGARASTRPGVRKERQFFKGEGKITPEDIAIFARQLATMLTAGIPMVQSFEIIGVGHDKPAMQKLVLAIKSDIETGNALNQALAKHPLYFDDLFVNLVEAGEHAARSRPCSTRSRPTRKRPRRSRRRSRRRCSTRARCWASR